MKLSIIFGLLIIFCSKPIFEQEGKLGSVKGTLCYPGHYIPQMNVYIKNAKTGNVYKTLVKENKKTFQFSNIPTGTYVAYAYTVKKTFTDSNGNSSKGSGGYTKMVPCGLSVNCKDHTLIEFKVIAAKTTSNIEICDWYGATVPNE
ncbi:hypothetical protein [Rufibacter quisquiliarum]|uniref:Carboxypeptidase regulatory-like domain-containing protein n=1 Tax=Rufibacter quisquiliarum TaxID=1549639 RepID=A0A839GJY3_9BACT|nr:hypothetical protein [Rufibacter quisquiliarum]MBA9079904.1 hypothetical protein [Rufibacter quisquiliarum]